jgi:chromosome segregation ATPase
MASIDDVFFEVQDLSARLWRGYSPTVGGAVGPGMVPELQGQVTSLTARVGGIESQVTENRNLLNAVNEQTLGRIETEIKDGLALLNAVNEQTLGRIETEIKDVLEFLPTVRQDMTDLQAKLDALKGDVQKEMNDLQAKLDGLKKDIQSSPHTP